MFDRTFIQILNMSLTACFIIAAVLAARLLLKRAPKIYSYVLWAVVLFRLLCPFSFESAFGLVPSQVQAKLEDSYSLIDENISFGGAAAAAWEAVGNAAGGGSGTLAVHSVNRPEDGESGAVLVTRWEAWILLGKYIWAAGIAVLLFCSFISLIKLRRRLAGAVMLRDNIWLAGGIESPFVMGVVRPRIYLPSGLSEREQSYIILHEHTHIRRGDHILRILSFIALCLHWFNPLVWAAFVLSGRDMEMSCDENVIKRCGEDIKEDYSASLLSLAAGRRVFAAMPPAFGDTGGRIKNVLRFRKPSRMLVAVAAALVVALSAGLAINGMGKPRHPDLRSFDANGFALGAAFDGGAELTQTAPLAGWQYDYNYEEAHLTLDAANGVVKKMLVNVYEGLRSHFLANSTPFWDDGAPMRAVDDIYDAMGYGKHGWHDRQQGLRYAEYRQADDGKETTVRFVYTDGVSDGIRRRLVWVIAESSYQYTVPNPNPAPTAAPQGDVSIFVRKDDGKIMYTLFDGVANPSAEEINSGRVFDSVDALNAALAEYERDTITTAHVQTTLDFTKDEAAAITDSIVIPSGTYSKPTGFYEPEPEETEPENFVPIYKARLTRDGSVQTISIDTSRLETEWLYYLRVTSEDGKILWEAAAALPHAGWNTVLLTRIDGEDYLMQYNPVTYQGYSSYSFRVFSLDGDGNEVILDSGEVAFTTNPPGGFASFRKRDIEPVKAFFEHVNQYLPHGELLVNTDDYIRRLLTGDQQGRVYGTQDAPITGLRDYFYESADLTISEQMDKFVRMYTEEYGDLEE